MLAIESGFGWVVPADLPAFRLRGFLIRAGLLDGFCGDMDGETSQNSVTWKDKLQLG